MPSTWAEPFGLVAVQTGQVGRPIVASHIGGLPEIVQNGVTGLLVPPGDVKALAAAGNRLLDQAELCRSLGTAAQAHVNRCFSLSACASAYDEVYAQIDRS